MSENAFIPVISMPGTGGGKVQLRRVMRDTIRQALRDEKCAQAGGTGDMHVHIDAIDAETVRKMFANNKASIAKILREHLAEPKLLP
jgi:hypothetical protein